MRRAILLSVTVLLAAGCGSSDKRFYAGDPLPADREIRLTMSGASITKVDGADAGLKSDGIARLAPGRHVIEATFYGLKGNSQYRSDPMPLVFEASPGKAYVAHGVAVNDRFFAKVLEAGLDPLAGDSLPNVATGRDRYPSPVVTRGERVARGARSVSGVLLFSHGSHWFDTAPGREVLLVPRNELAKKWVGKVDQKPVPLGPIGLLIAGGQAAAAARPDALAGDILTIQTTTIGGFTFYDVTPGGYYVIARGPGLNASVAEVDVAATDVNGIRLILAD